MKAGDTLVQKEAYTHADVSSRVPGNYDGKADLKNVAHLVSLLNTQPEPLFLQVFQLLFRPFLGSNVYMFLCLRFYHAAQA